MYSTPAVADDLVYIGSCSGIFYALDKRSGKVRWSYDITNDGRQTSFHGDMLLAGELVIIGTDGRALNNGIGHIYAFERSTGKVRWKFPAGRGVTTDVLHAGSRIFGVTMDDELLCLDLEQGRLLWSFKSSFTGFNENLGHSPAIAGGKAIFGGLDGVAYALDVASGKVVGKRNLGKSFTTSFIAIDGRAYVGTADGQVHGMAANTGALDWNIQLNKVPAGKPATSKGLLFLFLNRNGTPGNAEELVSLDLAEKKVRWRLPASSDSEISATPILEAGVASSGNQCPQPEKAWSTVSPYPRLETVLAGNNRGEVFAFRALDGAQVWLEPCKGTIRSFGSDGQMLFVGTVEGIIYCVQAKKQQ